MRTIFYTVLLISFISESSELFGQTNMKFSNPEVEKIILADYALGDYYLSTDQSHPNGIYGSLEAMISTDSLKSYLTHLSQFKNRNTGSDTLSPIEGIGAARTWVHESLESFGPASMDRLKVGYFQFDQAICGMGRHKNVVAVLPGAGPERDELIIIEGHMDSRCEDRCDGDCTAHGADDNGSGTILVMELARVLSTFTFNRTLVFMLTTGEEQGLLGANAFAEYCEQNNKLIQAVFNNDIVGGTECGETASPPGCPSPGHVDDVNVRVYSRGNFNSRSKALARFVTRQYREFAKIYFTNPNTLNIMSPEDRSGRGGDHIPFRQRSWAAIRFTSANEHGHGNPSATGYSDRQHTEGDLLGEDTNNDGIIDKYFVDFGYIKRNALINSVGIVSASLAPPPPDDIILTRLDNGINVRVVDSSSQTNERLLILRVPTNLYMDTVIAIGTDTQFLLQGLVERELYYVQAVNIDSSGFESLFSVEKFERFLTDIGELPHELRYPLELMQNRPNPFDVATVLSVRVDKTFDYSSAEIRVHGLDLRMLARLPIELNPGINEVVYQFENNHFESGTYVYSLWVDGVPVQTMKMVYIY